MYLRQAYLAAAGPDPPVAPQRGLQPPAQRGAVDARHQRARVRVHVVHDLVEVGRRGIRPLGELRYIRPGGKRSARPQQNHGVRLVLRRMLRSDDRVERKRHTYFVRLVQALQYPVSNGQRQP